MNPKELRIGNLFHPVNTNSEVHMPATGLVYKILELRAFDVSAISHEENPAKVEVWPVFSYKEISPIPLTPEILIKAGFGNTYRYAFVKAIWGNALIVVYFANNRPVITVEISEDETFLEISIPGKHLHQLQNLIFALTNQELNIEL